MCAAIGDAPFPRAKIVPSLNPKLKITRTNRSKGVNCYDCRSSLRNVADILAKIIKG